jgi:class 3 adenylate cyclase
MQWTRVGDRHRTTEARHRRREIDTAGDGFLASFDGPPRAVRCGRAIVDSVRKLGIHVRAGVHAGECEVIGEKLGGIAVHIGAALALSQRPMKCWCLGRSVTLWRDQASDLKSAGPTA